MTNWDEMSNEELCVEYQKTKSNDLFNHFYNKNKGLIGLEFSNRMKMYNDSLDSGDLAQFGRISLFEAMLNFKPELGYKFTTIYHFYALRQKMEHRRETLDLEMPKHMYSSMEKVNGQRTRVTNSLNDQVFNGDTGDEVTIEATLVDPDSSFEDEVLSKLTLSSLKDKMYNILRPREYTALIMYFGLDNKPPMTLQEVGDQFNVSRERIRQVIEKALIRLHHKLEVKNCE